MRISKLSQKFVFMKDGSDSCIVLSSSEVLTAKPLDQYLVGFWICAGISGMLKKNWLEKFVSPMKRSPWLYASGLQKLARRHFFDINEVSIVFSWEIDIKTGDSIWKDLIAKSL